MRDAKTICPYPARKHIISPTDNDHYSVDCHSPISQGTIIDSSIVVLLSWQLGRDCSENEWSVRTCENGIPRYLSKPRDVGKYSSR